MRRLTPGGSTARARGAIVVAVPPPARSLTSRPLDTLSDDALVARFRGGDDGAFEEIHRRYRPPLLAFARRMLNAAGHDADDVVQDAFVRAFRGLRVTDRPMALRPWLYAVVRNRALDELRAPQRLDGCDDVLACVAAPAPDAAQRAQERDELRRLVEEIARLPERQRLALVMRELDGCSHAETARRLRTSVPATKSLIVRARANLGAARCAA